MHPVEAPRSLTAEIVARLTADITSGNLPAGSRLPTEQEMIAAMGVSRTVVREAVAALRAERLVTTRQGVGAFVAETVRKPFRIEFGDLSSLREVLAVMELRTGVEIEAAGLAADRASVSHVRKIAAAFEAIESAMKRGVSSVDQDFAFHRAIADATGNPQFHRFLEYLGRPSIPRSTISGGPVMGDIAYGAMIQREHREILRAIREGEVRKARAAMRSHLVNSRNRYQKLAAKAETG